MTIRVLGRSLKKKNSHLRMNFIVNYNCGISDEDYDHAHSVWKAFSRGGASLGVTGAKLHFIFGDKKKGEWIFEKQFVHCIYNLLKERR
jgi:hypothetical protein